MADEPRLACEYCGAALRMQYEDDGDGCRAAHLYCYGCDARGPSSEYKYRDREEAAVDALARYAGSALRKEVERLRAEIGRLKDAQWAVLWSPDGGDRRLELFEAGGDAMRFSDETGGDVVPLGGISWHEEAHPGDPPCNTDPV